MFDLPASLPLPTNEPILGYLPGSPERQQLKAALQALATARLDIPHVVGGRELWEGAPYDVRAPHAHRQILATPPSPLGVDAFGLGEADEVADRPGHHVAVAAERSVAAPGRTEHRRQIATDGRFLSDDGDGHGVGRRCTSCG